MATMQRPFQRPFLSSLSKMVRLGKKIKLPKTCEKLFYKHITDVLCKKTPPENN